ncbi:MAG: hypothetical protein ATN36_08860 [Epulopiscium sp. Nele67-Bin005]|nr:MAG: hypothetical protein ATN36_08860 [Epulopiscium sp. Nele67-Bin005]
MGLYDKLTGKASEGANTALIEEYFLDDEVVLASFQYIRDMIIFTNLGIYLVDVQGITGRKIEVLFIPKRAVKSVAFETAGTVDLDSDVKLHVEGHFKKDENGKFVLMPILFKVPRQQQDKTKQIVNIVKTYYLA